MESTIENQGQMKEVKWPLSPTLTEKELLSSVAHNVISCLIINYSSEAGLSLPL